MIDAAQILFSDSYKITDRVTVRHSTLGDVINLGEEHYFNVLRTLTAIPSDEKYILHKQGIDWMEITDLEFFAMAIQALKPEETQIFLPGIDFTHFKLYKRDDGDIYYADKDAGIVLDFYSHKRILDCLCSIHRIKKKVEKAGNATTKQVLIEEDKERIERAKALKKEFKSSLVPLISSMVNREGFKYSYDSVKQLRFGQFMDACARLQLIVATDQLVQGIYAGTVDQTKIDKKKTDWTREI